MLLKNYQANQSVPTLDFSGKNNTQCPTKATSAKKHRTSTQKKTIKILVVEDEPINQYVAKSLLEAQGYQVDIAATGKAALNFYQTNQYAVVLMDMGLPDIKGTEVTRQIRELEKSNGQHVPIIALTANGLSAKTECLAAGMDDFSKKPFKIEKLKKLLEFWIEKSKQLQRKS